MQSRVLAFTALSLLACVVPRTVGTTVRVLLPEQLRAEYRAAPCEFFGPRNATVQASLVLADPSNACSPLRVPCGGAVLLAEPLSGCSFETKARHAQRAGCAAMLVHDDTFSVRARAVLLAAQRVAGPLAHGAGVVQVPGGSTSGLYQFDGRRVACQSKMPTCADGLGAAVIAPTCKLCCNQCCAGTGGCWPARCVRRRGCERPAR